MSREIFYKDGNTFVKVGNVPNATTTTPPTPTPSYLYDDFAGNDYSLTDGQTSPNGRWKCRFAGYGTVKVTSGVIIMTPKAATVSSETYGSCVDTTRVFKNFDLSLNVKTIKSLRTPTPNNWETAWVNWNSQDQYHHFAFCLKRDGWQLEKKDNENKDDTAEIFLSTGIDPDCKLNVSQLWRIRFTGLGTKTPRTEVWVDNALVTDYIDNKTDRPRLTDRMLNGGWISLYSEDASVAFDNIRIQEL